jgi:predicted hydrolase (HD superfamily)
MSEITDVGAAYDKQFERVSDTETVLREFYDKAYAAGVGAERERCALVCERKIDAPAGTYQILMASAKEIRKGE